MTTLRELNRAVQTAGFPSHDFAWAVREWIEAATEMMEPAPSEAKVECPNCRKQIATREWHVSSRNRDSFTCQTAALIDTTKTVDYNDELDARYGKPAPPEPADGGWSEFDAMNKPEPAAPVSDAVQRRILNEPDVVIGAVGGAVQPAAPEMPCPFCGSAPEITRPTGRSEWIPESAGLGSAGWLGVVAEASCRVCGVMRVPLAIWNKRNLAQPVAVRMTEELEYVLICAAQYASLQDREEDRKRIRERVVAVRQQAAQPVRLEKVPVAEIRSVVEIVKRTHCDSRVTQQIEAWLDAAEGKGEGRG